MFSISFCSTAGFPVIPSVFNFRPGETTPFARLCSFNWPRQDERHPRTLCDQAGNSMNTLVITALQLFSLTQYKYNYVPPLLANVAFAARASKAAQKRALLDGNRQEAAPKRYRLRSKRADPSFDADRLTR